MKEVTHESEKKAMAESIWLNYFNDKLLEEGAISQRDYHRMAAYIRNRKPKNSTTIS